MTERLDNLRGPLRPNREASVRDDRDTVLLRLLFCGETESREAAGEALGRELLEWAAASGLLEVSSGQARCPFHVRYVRDLLLVSDYLGGDGDAVMGAGETTAVLYQAARPSGGVGRTLDLGCGAGTLALLLASQSESVVGTDINERAIEFGRFNAELNGIHNAEFRAGDMYAPVAADSFDLLVSQPPYYPASHGNGHQTFLHGGIRGDELPNRVVAGVADHLTYGGRALVFTSWPEDRGPEPLVGFDVLEIYTRRNEVTGQRQSLNVFQHAADGRREWRMQFAVSAECWGMVDSRRIDEMFAVEALLQSGSLMEARLRLPEGHEILNESDLILLRFPERELVGCVPLHPEEWKDLQAVHSSGSVRQSGADPDRVGAALRRGLLRLRA